MSSEGNRDRTENPLDPLFDVEVYRGPWWERGMAVVVVAGAAAVGLGAGGLVTRFPTSAFFVAALMVSAVLWSFHRAFTVLILTREGAKVRTPFRSRTALWSGCRSARMPPRAGGFGPLARVGVAAPFALMAIVSILGLALGTVDSVGGALAFLAYQAGFLTLWLLGISVVRALALWFAKRFDLILYDEEGSETLRYPGQFSRADASRLRLRLISLGVKVRTVPPPRPYDAVRSGASG